MWRGSRGIAVACVAAALSACQESLYGGLSEHEANEMISALGDAKVEGAKVPTDDKGWRVEVAGGDVMRALTALRQRGLPRQHYTNLGEMFQRQGMVSTPAEERMRYIYAMSQELSRTIGEIDGVVTAHVHVVIPANDPFGDAVKPSSAAVFIKYSAGTDLRSLSPTVKDLVAHSIEGLSYDNVSLSFFESGVAAPTGPSSQPASVGAWPGWTSPVAVLAATLCGAAILALLLLLPGGRWRAVLGRKRERNETRRPRS